MKKTELKYWENGHSVRGNRFHAFAWSFLSIGFLLCVQLRGNKYFNFEIFKLTK